MLWCVTSSPLGGAQRWCCAQKSVCSGSQARTVVHAVHSMNSKRFEACAYPTTEACPKFWGVISYQQRLQTGGRGPNALSPRVGLQPYAPGGSGWLVGNLACMIDRHKVLQEGQTPPEGNMQSWKKHRILPSPSMAISIPPPDTRNLSFTCKNA